MEENHYRVLLQSIGTSRFDLKYFIAHQVLLHKLEDLILYATLALVYAQKLTWIIGAFEREFTGSAAVASGTI